MQNQPYLINLFGHSGAGKSTAAWLLEDKIHGLYTVDFDIVKQQLAGYYWKNDKEIARDLSKDFLNAVVDHKLPILLLLPPARSSEELEKNLHHATESGYKILHIEIAAPEDVLIERYKARLADWNAKRTPKTIDEYTAAIRTPYYRPDDSITFDSSQLTPDETVAAILAKLDL